MPRSAGPYGRIITSAGDVARLARARLSGEAVAAMQRREVDSLDHDLFRELLADLAGVRIPVWPA